MIASSVSTDWGCRREAVKCLVNYALSCAQEFIDSEASFLYKSMDPFLSVNRNSLHLMKLPTLWKSRAALMFSMWSSRDLSCHRRRWEGNPCDCER